jgi:hypothetical protein
MARVFVRIVNEPMLYGADPAVMGIARVEVLQHHIPNILTTGTL